jgi:hypothetical protein
VILLPESQWCNGCSKGTWLSEWFCGERCGSGRLLRLNNGARVGCVSKNGGSQMCMSFVVLVADRVSCVLEEEKVSPPCKSNTCIIHE